MTTNVLGYAAKSAKENLVPFRFDRRDPRPDDVVIEILYCGVEDYRLAIQNLVQTSLRSIIGEMNLDDALSSREKIKARLKENISDDIADWGIMLKTVEIQDISPSETMQKAMEEQAAAERARRATVTRAEGEKSAAILQAEGRLEASKLDARSKVVMAEGDQLAITKINFRCIIPMTINPLTFHYGPAIQQKLSIILFIILYQKRTTFLSFHATWKPSSHQKLMTISKKYWPNENVLS